MVNYFSYAEADWQVPDGAQPDDEGRNLQKARLAEGDAGFHSNIVRCPSGYVLPPHSHDHSELFIVLGGDCAANGVTLRPFDTLAIAANQEYGVVAGASGLEFMVVRNGDASLKVVP